MAESGDLDRRLRDALGTAQSSSWQPDDGTRHAVLSELGRRRARRLRIVVATLVVAVGGLATGTGLAVSGTASHPDLQAAGPGGQSKAHAPSTAGACGTVRVGSGSRGCVGTFIVEGGGLQPTSAPSKGLPFGSESTATPQLGRASPSVRPLTIHTGQRLTVSLPGVPGLVWQAPAGPSGLLRVHVTRDHATGGVTSTFVAVGAGSDFLQASASPTCVPTSSTAVAPSNSGPKSTGCPVGAQWSVAVTVKK